MKQLISRLIDHFGMAYTSHILDQAKTLGFRQATLTSISLGIDDLLTMPSKGWLVQDAEQQSLSLEKHQHYGNVYAIEKLRQSIEIWYATSEYLRQEMNPNLRMTDSFNSIYIMSISGARRNASQVHQLVAHKGVVDTVVRTSDAEYLTRRHISSNGVGVMERIFIQTLIGRVLANDVYMGLQCIATQNQDIGIRLVNRFITSQAQSIYIRSPFTCRRESVGTIARQSIGEPGTQLTLRTSHIGGVFIGGITQHVRAPSNGKIKFNEDLVHPTRTNHGHPAFLCYIDLHVTIESQDIIHKSTDVYHTPEYTHGNVHLLPKTSHLWDQNQMNVQSLYVEERYISDLWMNNDRVRHKLFGWDQKRGRTREFGPKYQIQIKVNRLFFIPEEVIIGVDTRIALNIRSQVGGLMDNISRYSSILIPPRRNNLQLQVVNCILYGDGKPIRGIFHTSIQLVRTCLVLNWAQDRNGTIEEEEAYTSLTVVRVNDLIRNFIGIDLVKSPISCTGKENDMAGSGFIPNNGSFHISTNPFQHQGTIRTLHNRNKEGQGESLMVLSSSNCSRIGPLNGSKCHNVTKESIQEDRMISIRNSLDICYIAILMGITRASLNTQSFISEARFVHHSKEHNNISLEIKKKNLFDEKMRDILFHHREFCGSCIPKNFHDTSEQSFYGI
ncbi:hypothetical protein AMTRI_Chr07g77430 [Amborella trichopoda]